MDSTVLQQLLDLAEAFNQIGLKPIICGGLAIYLLFRDRSQEIRATTDIDLMIAHSQAFEESKRKAIAEVITDGLKYVVCEDAKYFRFNREPGQQLDILAPPIEEVTMEGGRVKLVRSRFHGRLTPEACFIEEDLRTVDLAELTPTLPPVKPLLVNVPSPTNMLILKLFAFDDRDSDTR